VNEGPLPKLEDVYGKEEGCVKVYLLLYLAVAGKANYKADNVDNWGQISN